MLAFALEKTGSEQPNLGYATVYPLAMLLKILLVQLLLLGGPELPEREHPRRPA